MFYLGGAGSEFNCERETQVQCSQLRSNSVLEILFQLFTTKNPNVTRFVIGITCSGTVLDLTDFLYTLGLQILDSHMRRE